MEYGQVYKSKAKHQTFSPGFSLHREKPQEDNFFLMMPWRGIGTCLNQSAYFDFKNYSLLWIVKTFFFPPHTILASEKSHSVGPLTPLKASKFINFKPVQWVHMEIYHNLCQKPQLDLVWHKTPFFSCFSLCEVNKIYLPVAQKTELGGKEFFFPKTCLA